MTKRELLKKLKGIPDDTDIKINWHDIVYAGMQQIRINGTMRTAFVVSDDKDYCFEDKPLIIH